MQKTRRNVLAGLGGLTIAGGALFGTGAFSTAEASRDVQITTETDENAQIGLTPGDTSWVQTDGDGVLYIEALELNQNAEFVLDPALTVTNQSGQEVDVYLEIDDPTSDVTITSTPAAGSGDAVTLSDTDLQDYGLTFDTGGTGDSVDETISITVHAEDTGA